MSNFSDFDLPGNNASHGEEDSQNAGDQNFHDFEFVPSEGEGAPSSHDDGGEYDREPRDHVATEQANPDDPVDPEDAGGEVDHEPDRKSAGNGDTVINVIASLEEQLQQIRDAHHDSQAELTSLEERWTALEESERTLEAGRVQLQEQQRVITAQREQCDVTRQELDDRRRQIEQDERALEDLRVQIEQQEATAQEARAEIEAEKSRFAELQSAVAEQQAAIESERQRLDEQVTEMNARESRINREIDEVRGELETARAELASALSQRDKAEEDNLALLQQAQQAEENARDLTAELDTSYKAIEEHTAAAAALEDRVQELENQSSALQADLTESLSAKAALETRAAELEREAASLRGSLDEEISAKQALETQVSELERDAASLRASLDAEMSEKASLEAQVVKLQTRLDAVQASLDEESSTNATLQKRIGKLEDEARDLRDELDLSKASIAAAEQENAERVQRAERQRDRALGDVKKRETELATAETDLASLRDEHDALQAEFRSIQDDAERLRSEIASRESTIEALSEERARISAARDELAAAVREHEATIESLRSDADTLSRDVAARDARISELESDLVETRGVIESQEKTLGTAKSKLAEFAQAISEQTEQIQRGAAAVAEVREQKRTIERLKQQLAQANMAADPDELLRKDERIAELTEALHQARGQCVQDGDIAERDARIGELQIECDGLRRDFEHTKIELREALSEVEALRSDSSAAAETQIVGLQARIRELEVALAEQEAAGAGSADAAEGLKQKSSALKEAAQHLRRRKERLARAKRLLRQKESSAGSFGRPSAASFQLPGSSMAPEKREELMRLEAQIREEQAGLREATRALAASERTMVKRWARPRAVITMTWFVVLMLLLSAVSWVAADRFFPAVRSASVTIKAEPKPGFPLAAEQATEWQSWHEAILSDDGFIRVAAKRFADRRFDELKDPLDLKKYLTANLTTDSTKAGELMITLTGPDAEKVAATLDALTVTLLAESRRLAGQRSDGARTRVEGQKPGSNSQTEFAKVYSVPVSDERPRYAGTIFGGSMFVALVCIVFIYRKLSKARRIFDEDAEVNLLHVTAT